MTNLFGMLLTAVDVAGAIAVTIHVLLKRVDVRASAGWIALSWLSPIAGSVLYFLFGINRIARRAVRIRKGVQADVGDQPGSEPHVEVGAPELEPLSILTRRVSGRPLTPGNRVDTLIDGDMAYPAMLQAIDQASASVVLCSYIFRADEAGRPFIDALTRARRRGVSIRVLLDGVGTGYFRSPAARALAEAGIPVARFLRSWLPWRMPFLNLRLHKKILIVDGHTGFTGGINIGAENLCSGRKTSRTVRDTHFMVTGPVVADLVSTFDQDWSFATGKRWRPSLPQPELEVAGSAYARGVQSGPDDDIAKIEMIMMGAVNAARSRVRIVTPYFLPDRTLHMALVFAALRGVSVDIVIPRASDHRIFDWASRAQLATLLDSGCRVHLSAAPLDHSKMMTVDGAWCLVGSANWDVRSLRLNFEFVLEVWDKDFAERLDALMDKKAAASPRLTAKQAKSGGRLFRVRNAAARLLLPYL